MCPHDCGYIGCFFENSGQSGFRMSSARSCAQGFASSAASTATCHVSILRSFTGHHDSKTKVKRSKLRETAPLLGSPPADEADAQTKHLQKSQRKDLKLSESSVAGRAHFLGVGCQWRRGGLLLCSELNMENPTLVNFAFVGSSDCALSISHAIVSIGSKAGCVAPPTASLSLAFSCT